MTTATVSDTIDPDSANAALALLRDGTAPKFVADRTGLSMGQVLALAELNRLVPGAPALAPSTPAARLAPVPDLADEAGTGTGAAAAAQPAPAGPDTQMRIPSVTALLKWAEAHPDASVRDHATQARTVLLALRERHAADLEITALTSEMAELDSRRGRVAERLAALQPAPAKTVKPKRERDYDPKAVRAWAAENGLACPALGRVPGPVLDAWRKATSA
jgi:hypothetical protein